MSDAKRRSEKRRTGATTGVRLTADEAAAIRTAAEVRGIGPSTFVREAALRAASLPVPKRARERDVFAAEVAPLLLALARVGNNLNQLAKVANTSGSVPDRAAIEQTRALLGAVHRVVAQRA